VAEALARLGRRFVLFGLTNGNAGLEATGLTPHLRGVISARDCGVAKPDARIFAAACAALAVSPAEVLHVGDDWALDVVGARQAGLHSAWVRRSDAAHRPAPASGRPQDALDHLHHLTVPDLARLADLLGV
jgi:putative hydrolase of the HAD superfamily